MGDADTLAISCWRHVVVDGDDGARWRMSVAVEVTSLTAVEDRLQLKNYLLVLRLLKHLSLYYSRVSNCSIGSMASHKTIVAVLAEFGNSVVSVGWLSVEAAAFGSKSRCSGADVAWE